MRIAVHYLVDVTPEERRALAAHLRQEGFASRDTIKEFFATHGTKTGRNLLRLYLREYYRGEAKRLEEKAEKLKSEDET